MKQAIIILAIATIIFLAGCAEKIDKTEVTNFDECVAAGNPVMESYPRQCRHDSQTFVEEIDRPVEPPEQIASEDPEEQQQEEPYEDASERAGTIAMNYVQDLPAYKDYNGRNILVNNVQVARCVGCFDVEVEFDRDSAKNPGGTTNAILHVILKDWKVTDMSARYEDT